MQLERGQKALILGLGITGESVARLLLRHGLEVVVNEKHERRESEPEADRLVEAGAEVVFGGHPLTLLDRAPDFIVKNPGIRYDVPLVEKAIAGGISVYTDIEVASWLTDSPIIAITGSNGKTTTTTLVGEMLAEAGLHPVVAGNIGRGVSDVVETLAPAQPLVLEVSSFQMIGTRTLHPRVAALLNLYPAHLDYHGSYDAYVEAKWHLFDHMTFRDTAVLNFDNRDVRAGADQLSANVQWFSRQGPVEAGVYLQGDEIIIRQDGQDVTLMALSEVVLKGAHNVENVLAAIAISLAAGATMSAIAAVLRRFQGVEHRLEFVKNVAGVDYYNDSKATNPQAALQAIRSFPGHIIWIAGGLRRKDNFQVMKEDLKERVRHALLLGESREEIAAVCDEAGVPYQYVTSIPEAVREAHRVAESNNVVLLSPACASWDMFKSFEERGRMFKDVVHTL